MQGLNTTCLSDLKGDFISRLLLRTSSLCYPKMQEEGIRTKKSQGLRSQHAFAAAASACFKKTSGAAHTKKGSKRLSDLQRNINTQKFCSQSWRQLWCSAAFSSSDAMWSRRMTRKSWKLTWKRKSAQKRPPSNHCQLRNTKESERYPKVHEPCHFKVKLVSLDFDNLDFVKRWLACKQWSIGFPYMRLAPSLPNHHGGIYNGQWGTSSEKLSKFHCTDLGRA